MDFQLLGPVAAYRDGLPLALGGRNQRALLALLLLRPGEALNVERIADTLWAGQTLADPANAVQAAVSRMRRTLGDTRDCRIVTCPGAYVFSTAADRIDVGQFTSMHSQARSAIAVGDTRRAADLLRSALALRVGSPLGELGLEPFFDREAARIEELLLEALEDRIDCDLALGRHRFVVAELQPLVGEHPLRERLWAALILALYRSDRQSHALEAYREMRRHFVDQLGIEPGPHLKTLERAILRQDPSLDPATPPRRPVDGTLTSLLGRERDVDATVELITRRDVRLVTLTGAGGIGKSRLAETVAAAVADRFQGGAVVVEAATAVDEAALALAVAERLGANSGDGAGVTESVIARLRQRPVMLVIDNVEQLLPDLGFVPRLLRAAPDLTVLLTSRVATRLNGEHEFAVEGLELPPPGCTLAQLETHAASALLLERCRARNPRPGLAERDADAVQEICVRLAGVPLALELAAGCANLLTLEQIAGRLDDSLGLLTQGHSDAPARQRTMLATIEWSHRLLEQPTQELLARLSVFAGGCTLRAAEEVCGEDVLEGLSTLLDANLLSRTDDPTGGRFDVLQPVREFAQRRLGELPDSDGVRERHARHFARTLSGTRRVGCWRDYTDIDRVALELANVRAALAWATGAGRGDLALPLAGALGSLCLMRGHVGEARAWMEEAIATCRDAPARLRATADIGLVSVLLFQDEYPEAERLARQVLEVGAGVLDPIDHVYAHNCVAWTAALQGDPERAVAQVERGMKLISACSPEDAAWGIHQAALVMAEAGRTEQSLAWLRDSLRRFRELGATRATVACLSNLSVLEIVHGDLPEARRLLHECLSLTAEHGDASMQSCAVGNLAMVEALEGDPETARALVLDALTRNATLTDRRGMIENVLVAAAVADALGLPSRAVTLLAAAERLHDEVGFVLSPGELVLMRRSLDDVRAAAGAGAVDRARELLGPLDVEGVVELARSALTESAGTSAAGRGVTDAPLAHRG